MSTGLRIAHQILEQQTTPPEKTVVLDAAARLTLRYAALSDFSQTIYPQFLAADESVKPVAQALIKLGRIANPLSATYVRAVLTTVVMLPGVDPVIVTALSPGIVLFFIVDIAGEAFGIAFEEAVDAIEEASEAGWPGEGLFASLIAAARKVQPYL